MRFLKVIFRIILGLIFGILSGLALVPASAAFASDEGVGYSTLIVWGMLLFCLLLVAFAPTIRRAFGRGFLVLGASVLLLPVSMMLRPAVRIRPNDRFPTHLHMR